MVLEFIIFIILYSFMVLPKIPWFTISNIRFNIASYDLAVFHCHVILVILTTFSYSKLQAYFTIGKKK